MLKLHNVRHGWLSHYAADLTIGRSLELYGEWAEAEIYLISKFVHAGDWVLDVGANVGTHSLAFSRMVGRQGRVLAFDGQHKIFQVLGMNMLINDAPQVDCLNVLVGAVEGTYQVPVSDLSTNANFGAMSFRGIVEEHTPVVGNTLSIAMVSIDSLNLARLDFVKVDVEGMELDVFRGAEQTIRTFRPPIYFEQTTERNLPEIFELLRSLDYDLRWHISNPFNKVNFNAHALNIFGGACEVNILALPRERADFAEMVAGFTTPMTVPVYDPVIPADSPAGWMLPAGAYDHLPPTQNMPCVVAGAVPEVQDQLARLRQQFAALLEDRTKAQEIMEFLSRELDHFRCGGHGTEG